MILPYIGDVLEEQHGEDEVLVGVGADGAAKGVAGRPEGFVDGILADLGCGAHLRCPLGFVQEVASYSVHKGLIFIKYLTHDLLFLLDGSGEIGDSRLYGHVRNSNGCVLQDVAPNAFGECAFGILLEIALAGRLI